MESLHCQVLGVGKGEELLVPCKMFAHPQVPIIRTMISMINDHDHDHDETYDDNYNESYNNSG